MEVAATTLSLSTSHMSAIDSAMLEVKKCDLKQASPILRAPFVEAWVHDMEKLFVNIFIFE